MDVREIPSRWREEVAVDAKGFHAFGYELAEIAADAIRGAVVHDRLLKSFATATAASAAIVTQPDPVSGALRVMAIEGYGSQAVRLMTSRRLLDQDPAMLSIGRDRGRAPVRSWNDPDYVYEESPSVRHFLGPAGFNGGLSVRFFATSGRHVGDLHLSTRSSFAPSAVQLEAITCSVPVVASMLSACGGSTGPEAAIEDGQVLSQAPSLDSADMVAVAALISGPPDPKSPAQRSRLWRGAAGQWYRVDIARHSQRVTAAVNRVDLPHGLTLRELIVLDRLCLGLTNGQLAEQMFLSERTVAHHVERILSKLGSATRTAAVATAIHEGLLLLGARDALRSSV